MSEELVVLAERVRQDMELRFLISPHPPISPSPCLPISPSPHPHLLFPELE
jgi:hypothetical protein